MMIHYELVGLVVITKIVMVVDDGIDNVTGGGGNADDVRDDGD